MAKMALSKLSVDEMMNLRDQIEQALTDRSRELNRQLALISKTAKAAAPGKRRGRPPKSETAAKTATTARKRGKVAPKYRSSAGDTWTGRGRQPRWLAAELKGGAKLDDFLIGR